MEEEYLSKKKIIKSLVENKVNTMSEADITETGKKQKQKMVIGEGALAIIVFILFAVLNIYCIDIYGNELPIWLYMFSIGSGIILVMVLIIMLICDVKKSNKRLASDYFYSKIANSINVEEIYKNPNIDFRGIKVTKIISTAKVLWYDTYILIDMESKKYIIQCGKSVSNIYDFSDVINYEVYENGNSVVQGTAGTALIGGAFFGLAGLIIGSNVNHNIDSICTRLQLVIRNNDASQPQLTINFINGEGISKTSSTYEKAKKNLQEMCSILEYMINQKTLEESVKTKTLLEETKSPKEQLQELKDMLDENLITQEEYEKKKKQILDL